MEQDIATPPTPMRGMHWIVLGADGLRAGWGILLFIVLFSGSDILVGRLLRRLVHFPHHLAVFPLRVALISECAQLIPLLFATAIMALIERRPLLAYGFQGKARAVRFFSGLAWGLIALSSLALVLWKAGLLAFDGVQLQGAAIWQYAFGWALLFLLVALFEESAVRGYLQFALARGIGFWWGALLLSCLFGFSHTTNAGETPVGLFGAAAVGMVFCLSLWYTGSLWWAVGCHAGWDWAQSYLYGTSDSGMLAAGHLFGSHPIGPRLWSGGATGPEGSLLVLLLVAVMALLMWRWWGPRVQSPFRGSGWRPAWFETWSKASRTKPAQTLPAPF